jgi:hypothetical protein
MIRIACEPGFFHVGTDLAQIGKTISRYFRRSGGIKHVWDPNGWPFRNPTHNSSLEALVKCDELILPNAAVLDRADRIAILRRKNAFYRTLSDLWGQQTNLWGHDPHQPHNLSEVRQYREAVSLHVPSELNADVLGWYMDNAERWENAIIDELPPAAVKMFFYEDLFEPEMPQDRVPPAWNELAEWIGSKPDFSSPEVQRIISPDSKLNSDDIYERIPNFQELKASFG